MLLFLGSEGIFAWNVFIMYLDQSFGHVMFISTKFDAVLYQFYRMYVFFCPLLQLSHLNIPIHQSLW